MPARNAFSIANAGGETSNRKWKVETGFFPISKRLISIFLNMCFLFLIFGLWFLNRLIISFTRIYVN